MKKTLYILRHAKAEVGGPTQEDADRGLMERGIRAAESMGKYLEKNAIKPDLVLCSTAVRTRQTLSQIFPSPLVGEGREGGLSPNTQASSALIEPPLPNPPPQGGREWMEYTEKLYLASDNELLNLISETPENVGSLMIVGHNPGLHQLCLKLAKEGDDKLLDTMMLKFPTCTFAAISLGDSAWNNVARADGELKMFVMPENLGN